MLSDTHVLLDISDSVAFVTLNRPERLNALTHDLMVDLRRVLKDVATSDSIRAISLTGAGRGFCAGQDLSERDPRTLDGPPDLAAIQRDLFHPVIRTLAETPKPVVARVNGVAAGAGAALALAADIVVAADTATFAFSFSKVGLSVDAGLGRALAQRVGTARARALLMLGETLSAPEAVSAGMIHRSVTGDTLDTEHDRIMRQLAAAPRQALAGIKQALSAAHLPLADYLEIESAAQGRAGADPDYAEGVLAFLERRPARFS